MASPTRINLEEPVRVANTTRINLEEPVVSIYVDIRYLRSHFYSYPLMPSMMGTGVLQVRA